MKNSILIIPLIIICCSSPSMAKISEKTLSQYRSAFMERVIEDNADYENEIRRYLKGVVLEGRVGISLMDKFGLFLSNMEKKGVDITRIRFYGRENLFCLFIIMKDRKDDQPYTLFLEYEYGRSGRCTLKDIYFSIVFEERMSDIRGFFEAR